MKKPPKPSKPPAPTRKKKRVMSPLARALLSRRMKGNKNSVGHAVSPVSLKNLDYDRSARTPPPASLRNLDPAKAARARWDRVRAAKAAEAKKGGKHK